MSYKKKLTVWDYPLENSGDLTFLEAQIDRSINGDEPIQHNEYKSAFDQYITSFANEPLISANNDPGVLFASLNNKQKYAIVDDRAKQVIAIGFFNDDECCEQEKQGYRAIPWNEVERNLARSGAEPLTGKLKPIIFEAKSKAMPTIRYLRATYVAYSSNELGEGLYELLRRIQRRAEK